jgi:toxin ParE1/3/4
VLRLQFHRLAAREYREARDWYRARSLHAWERFKLEVEAAIRKIENDPTGNPRMERNSRYVRVKDFRYVIIYQQLSEERIRVLAVAHTARRPGYWRRRN